ncbi:MAG: hypothetical protein IH586_15835 [Anaerolineaceae bacterium]|nr:hypothetical protein [Anaerolineaceae bacterium]
MGFPLMLVKLELGYLELQENNLDKARSLFQEGLQDLLRWRDQSFTSCVIDGMAQLAAREGRMERAALLFGTKLWCGFAHILTIAERAEREAVFAEIRMRLGAERFEQMGAEGRAMNFTQVLALMKDDDGQTEQVKSTPHGKS